VDYTTAVLLYYITDRLQFSGDERARRGRLLATMAAAARAGIDYIQLRERDLTARDLEDLARSAVQVVREAGNPDSRHPRTRLLINSRTDIALAVGADGVHLRSGDLAPSEVRAIWSRSAQTAGPAGKAALVVAASCHTAAEVGMAEAHGADFAVFAPVFEKVALPPGKSPGLPPQQAKGRLAGGPGLEGLRQACLGLQAQPGPECSRPRQMPVLALGGVTLANANACLEAGASGIAAIRLFQEHDITQIVMQLRAQES
jgi:thiamine-phosphate pyrophosphorylase